MASASEELDEIDRIHDQAPHEAVSRLRALEFAQLPQERAALAAFLLNHVIGEKLGAWREAAERVEQLRTQLAEPPLAVVLHAAVADSLAGRGDSEALAALIAMSSQAAASCAIGLRRLGFATEPIDPLSFAAALRDLASSAEGLVAGTALDPQLAAGLNNATSRLLDLDCDARGPVVREALQAGAAQALRFWRAAGSWVHHERALYLVTLAANRVGAHEQARAAARQALELIAANGKQDVDRAFLLLQLAGAEQRLGDAAAALAARRDAETIAGAWTEASLTDWFASERGRLFGAAAESA